MLFANIFLDIKYLHDITLKIDGQFGYFHRATPLPALNLNVEKHTHNSRTLDSLHWMVG
jgi:hypothetical protein